MPYWPIRRVYLKKREKEQVIVESNAVFNPTTTFVYDQRPSFYDQTDQPDEDELDSIIDDQTPTPSQNMANELLTLNLNDSRSECTESITKSQNLKQSSISSYFHKK